MRSRRSSSRKQANPIYINYTWVCVFVFVVVLICTLIAITIQGNSLLSWWRWFFSRKCFALTTYSEVTTPFFVDPDRSDWNSNLDLHVLKRPAADANRWKKSGALKARVWLACGLFQAHGPLALLACLVPHVMGNNRILYRAVSAHIDIPKLVWPVSTNSSSQTK